MVRIDRDLAWAFVSSRHIARTCVQIRISIEPCMYTTFQIFIWDDFRRHLVRASAQQHFACVFQFSSQLLAGMTASWSSRHADAQLDLSIRILVE